MSYDLFVSYARRDNERGQISDLIAQIKVDYRRLADEELRCFFDTTEIHTMDDWRNRILGALRESNLLLLVLSPAYLASQNCEWEIIEFLKYEHSRTLQGEGVAPIYFVEIPGLDSSEFQRQAATWLTQVRQRHHVDLRPWYDEGAAALSREDVRKRLEDLERSLVDRLTRLRRIVNAPGNLPAHNPHFVGREVEMERLHRAAGLGQFGVLAAVHGIGGLGKTALAVQYAYAYADFFPGGRWLVGCAGKSSLAGVIRSLDVDLGIQLTDDEKFDDLRATKRILAALRERAEQGAAQRFGERNPPKPWALLILDNVDEPAILQPPETDPISSQKWLHVLATTRIDPMLIGVDQTRFCHLPVDELPEGDALRLIESYQPTGQLANEAERAAALDIARLLGGFTLAIEVVAVHLGERSGQLSCAALLERLRKEGVDSVALQTRGAVNHGERLMAATLTPTFEILTAHERRTLWAAAQCPADNIPLPWLRQVVGEIHPEVMREAKPGHVDPWLIIVSHLVGLRLLQVVDWAGDCRTPLVCRMHRLIQSVTQQQAGASLLDIETSLTQVVEDRARVLEAEWYQLANRWEILSLSHYAQQSLERERGNAPWLAHQTAFYLHKVGDYNAAEVLSKRSLSVYERIKGPDHPEVATSLNNLALLKQDMGKYAAAGLLFSRSLAIREKTLGPIHSQVAASLNNLASLYQDQGRYAEAVPLLKRSLAIWEKINGSYHPDVATCLNNLASLYQGQGQYTEAELIFKRSLAISEKTLGPDHPEVATSLSNLALLYRIQGQYAKAEPLYLRSLAISEKTLGPEHPDVASILNNLALLHGVQCQYAKAEPLYLRSMAIKEKILGPDHPSVATSLNNLALLHSAQGQYAKAEPLFKRSLAIREKTLGPDHPEVAMSLNNLAELYRAQSRYGEAESHLKRSLAICEQVLGSDHSWVATILNNFALLYLNQGYYTEAEPLFKRSLAISEKSLGPDHPEVATSLYNLSSLYRRTGRDSEAETLEIRAASIRAKTR